jgi:hypothetical protein
MRGESKAKGKMKKSKGKAGEAKNRANGKAHRPTVVLGHQLLPLAF